MTARALLIAACLALPAVPAGLALAQAWTPPPADAPAPAPETDPGEGLDLIERGAGILFQDLLDRVGPQIDQMGRDMGEAVGALGPAVSDLARLVDDMRNYERPQRLENGDILIRRKADAPPPPALGEGLKPFAGPDGAAPEPPAVPVDPNQPQTEI